MGRFWRSFMKGRPQRQSATPSPEPSSTTIGNRFAPLEIHHSAPSTNPLAALMFSTVPATSSVVSKPGAGNSNSLPGHQSGRSNVTHNNLLDQKTLNLSDSLNNTNASGDRDVNSSLNNSPSTTLLRKKNLSTSDLDPIERKKQAALVKVEAKLHKAQCLHQKAQQSVEQEISEFLRVTSIPHPNTDVNSSSRPANLTYDKRIRTFQDTKKELERKIASYQSDISRIQAGDIPTNYSSKDILSNIKSTAVKVAGGSLKHRSSNSNDQAINLLTSNTNEQLTPFHYPESNNHSNLSTTLVTPTTTSTSHNNSGAVNNNQNLLTLSQHSNILEPTHSSLSSSTSNEIGNSQFYIDSSHEHVWDADKSSRKYDVNIPADGSILHDHDKSPSTRRRLTDDSNIESNDRTSDHSTDDRLITNNKRNPSTTTEYHQLNIKLDSMQKIIDRYETKMNEMQKQLESTVLINENQHERNERLNAELADLTDLHQNEMSSMKTDLKNLEDRLLYKFNDYWNELLEKLDKLDTRTAKVEQTLAHSHETEENTHRIISKLVNILLTVFAIILLLLSTIKNLVQSRVHAMTLLILALIWITFHYLPQNYFQTSFLKNFPNMFKRTS